jgi:hypothetical protein
VNLATYTDSFCQSSKYSIVVQGTVGVCVKNREGAQTTMISSDPSPTPAPTVFLDGYLTFKYYRSDRGVTICNGPLVSAATYKMNTCKTVEFSYSYNYLSVMVVSTGTTFYSRFYTDKKCQNLLRIDANTYAAGVCVEGGDKLSMIASINTKISTDLTALRVTRV